MSCCERGGAGNIRHLDHGVESSETPISRFTLLSTDFPSVNHPSLLSSVTKHAKEERLEVGGGGYLWAGGLSAVMRVLPAILARIFASKKRQIPSTLSAICLGQWERGKDLML